MIWQRTPGFAVHSTNIIDDDQRASCRGCWGLTEYAKMGSLLLPASYIQHTLTAYSAVDAKIPTNSCGEGPALVCEQNGKNFVVRPRVRAGQIEWEDRIYSCSRGMFEHLLGSALG